MLTLVLHWDQGVWTLHAILTLQLPCWAALVAAETAIPPTSPVQPSLCSSFLPRKPLGALSGADFPCHGPPFGLHNIIPPGPGPAQLHSERRFTLITLVAAFPCPGSLRVFVVLFYKYLALEVTCKKASSRPVHEETGSRAQRVSDPG